MFKKQSGVLLMTAMLVLAGCAGKDPIPSGGLVPVDTPDSGGGTSADTGPAPAVPCTSDKQCLELNQVCDTARQKCVDCISKKDCPEGKVCFRNICETRTTCQSDDPCLAETKVCAIEQGFCVDCVGDSACPQGKSCKDFVCEANPDQPPPAQTCQADRDCGENQVCRNTKCERPCAGAEACSPDRPICDSVSGVCVQCLNNDQCPEGLSCVQNSCRKVCQLDIDCNRGEICDNGGCVLAKCQTDRDCGDKEKCQNSRCVPQLCSPSCTGKQCGDDGCGSPCGACKTGEICQTGQCVKPPPKCPDDKDCRNRQCGVDPVCGLSCGSCAANELCDNNKCVKQGPKCPDDKDCTSRQCGTDPVCGVSCGTCAANELCDNGKCVKQGPKCPEDKNCTGRQCGNDPVCGVSCGTCTTGTCNSATGACETTCVPATCTQLGKNCGTVNDGCGGILNCGTCAAPQFCGGGGVLNVCGGCQKNCTGKQCGPDGCGGSCGTCNDSSECTEDSCNTNGTCKFDPVPKENATCDDKQFCTVSDACKNGVCTGSAKDCSSAGDICNTGSCNESEDKCVSAPKTNGTACDDGKGCTSTDICTNGVCGGTSTCKVDQICKAPSTCEDIVAAVPPFDEGFESGSLGGYWLPKSSNKGQIKVTKDNAPRAGQYHVTMDTTQSSADSLNELTLVVNLQGQNNVVLEFYHKEFSDEDHAMPTSFAASSNSDGVAISVDGGANWRRVQGLTFTDGINSTYTFFRANLSDAASAAGLTLSNRTFLRFQQYGRNPISSDGFAFDDIKIYSCAASCSGKQCGEDGCGKSCGVCVADANCGGTACSQAPAASLPFTDGFEGNSLGQSWVPRSSNRGKIEITSGLTPVRSGSRHAAMAAGRDGWENLNELTLVVNLGGASNPVLDFWVKEFSDDDHPMPASFTNSSNSDGVALSVDGGANWKRVQNLTSSDGVSSSYKQFRINLKKWAQDNGVTLASRTLIRFQQYGNQDWDSSSGSNDGFAFDDVSITDCSPACSGKVCGDDGCASTCGTCPTGQACTPQFTCDVDGCGNTSGLQAGSPWPMGGYCPSRQSRSIRSGAQTNAVKWTYSANGKIQGGIAVAADGTIYFGAADRNIYAVSSTGSFKWAYLDPAVNSGANFTATPAIDKNGDIYLGATWMHFYALKPDGSLKWKKDTGSSRPGFTSSAVVTTDGRIHAASDESYLYNFAPTDGSFSRTDLGSTSGTLKSRGPALTLSGSMIYGALRTIWTPSGTITLTSPDAVESMPVTLSDGNFYISAGELKAYTSSRSLRWEILPGGFVGGPIAIGPDGTVYVAASSRLYAYSSTGSSKWSFNTGGAITCTPAVGNDGVVYFGSADGKVYAVKPDGSQLWAVTTGGPVSSSPAIGSDGTVYIGSDDQKLYAIGP